MEVCYKNVFKFHDVTLKKLKGNKKKTIFKCKKIQKNFVCTQVAQQHLWISLKRSYRYLERYP